MTPPPSSIRDNVVKDECKTKEWFPCSTKECSCEKCSKCNDSVRPDCVLFPYKPGCCTSDAKGHHIIPVHCFMKPGKRGSKTVPDDYMDGWSNYNEDDAPVICLTEKEHLRMHTSEANKPEIAKGNRLSEDGSLKCGSWSYEEARDEMTGQIVKLLGKKDGSDEDKCKPDCIKEQLDNYHQKKAQNGKEPSKMPLLRADISGRKMTSKTGKLLTAMEPDSETIP